MIQQCKNSKTEQQKQNNNNQKNNLQNQIINFGGAKRLLVIPLPISSPIRKDLKLSKMLA